MNKRTARTNRIAYQIWALIERTGGDCTVHDMAEVTGESWQTCRNVCVHMGWGGRCRVISPVKGGNFWHSSATTMFDAALYNLERFA